MFVAALALFNAGWLLIWLFVGCYLVDKVTWTHATHFWCSDRGVADAYMRAAYGEGWQYRRGRTLQGDPYPEDPENWSLLTGRPKE